MDWKKVILFYFVEILLIGQMVHASNLKEVTIKDSLSE
jgi:hypothetical protein